jgi:DNA polymerase-1
MYEHGVRVDTEKADRISTSLKERLREAQECLYLLAPGVNPNSSQQVAAFLMEGGLEPPVTEVGNYSVTKQWLSKLGTPFSKAVLDVRKLSHMVGTFVDGYIFANADENSVVHGQFHQLRTAHYGTVSGRFSSGGGLNLQNVPARDEEFGPLIRSMFIPWSNEHQWCKIDLSQIEYRCFAHYMGGRLAEAYVSNPEQDFHQMVADMAKIPRRPAKTLNFGILYGMGEKKTAEELGVSLTEARELLNAVHSKVPEMRQLAERVMRRAATKGHIYTLLGRRRHFIGVKGVPEFTHKALNALLQGTAADVMKLAILEVASEVDWDSVRLHLTVHDELDFSVPKGEEGVKIATRLRELMETTRLRVPILAEMTLGTDWGHTAHV